MASRQHGYINRQQLLAMGLSASAIARRTDLIASRHTGVCAVGHVERTPAALAHAAILARGTGAVLSHASAAALWGLRRWPRRPEVTSARDHRRPGITTHQTTTLTAADATVNYGIPVTTVVRTITDLAPRLTDRELIRAVQEARLADLLKPDALRELMRRCPRAGRLIDPSQNATRSTLEDEFVAWLGRHHLPTPRVNAIINGREVDMLFEAERVIVELDSWSFHGDPVSFRTDRRRDVLSAAEGFLTLRLIPELLTDADAERLRHILRQRRP